MNVAFISYILQVVLKQRQTFCWAGLVAALTQRCKLESNNRRRVERCMKQLEVGMADHVIFKKNILTGVNESI